MKPILYGAPLSPFVRKVRIFMGLKGLEYDSKMIVPYATPEDYVELSPLRKIPALTLEGQTYADSAVICHLLEKLNPELSLIPTDPVESAQCEWFEKYGDYELSRVLTFGVFFHRVLKKINREEVDEERVENTIQTKVPPLLDYLEAQLDGLHFVGDRLTLADISILTQFVSYEHAEGVIDPDKWPKLAHFSAEHQKNPVISEIIHQEIGSLRKLLKDYHR